VIALLAAVALAGPEVVVLKSDTLEEYAAPVEAFRAYFDAPVYDIRGDRGKASGIVAHLEEREPRLIFALGAKAAYVAVHELPDIPVVYAMVAEPERYGLTGERVTGVEMAVPPAEVLAQFKLFNPEVERIGVILSDGNERAMVARSIATATQLGYRVIVRRVESPREVRRAFAGLREQVDALWLLPDSVIITPTIFHFLRDGCQRAGLPVLAYSRTLVEAGALMGLTPDPTQVGEQAAELVMRISGGTPPGELPPMMPSQPLVVVNQEALEATLGELDPVLLDFVDVMIEPGRR